MPTCSGLLLATKIAAIMRIPGRSWWGSPISPTSLGPWGHVAVQGRSAVLVDVPYYSKDLVEEVLSLAPDGVTHLFLTHDDFVRMSDHAMWKRAFPDAIRVAHCADCAPGSVDMELSGAGPWHVAGFRVDRVPGHSEGSLFYASPELSAVFTGDSIALWDGKPTGFRSHCRFGPARQAQSLRGYVAAAPFCAGLMPGHGLPAYFSDADERASFFDAAARSLDGGGSRQ